MFGFKTKWGEATKFLLQCVHGGLLNLTCQMLTRSQNARQRTVSGLKQLAAEHKLLLFLMWKQLKRAYQNTVYPFQHAQILFGITHKSPFMDHGWFQCWILLLNDSLIVTLSVSLFNYLQRFQTLYQTFIECLLCLKQYGCVTD